MKKLFILLLLCFWGIGIKAQDCTSLVRTDNSTMGEVRVGFGFENGLEFVDLGLPSGMLWATCNVGANAPEEYGNYYAWGETTPKSDYSWATYKYANGDYTKLTKYCYDSSYGNNGFTDSKTVLDLTDDAARANWGGNWRMPTADEVEELLNNCTWTWTTRNGVNGYNVEGPNGNSIFLPAAGCRNGTNYAGSSGVYWSSTLLSSYRPDWSNILALPFRYQKLEHVSRFLGQSVRPVCEPMMMVSGTAYGHGYVDLGLPSGLLWATCNVGANAIDEGGNHYAWGETETKSDYTVATYKWCNGDMKKLTKYCNNSDQGYNGFTDDKTVLELTDDAARANWGGKWRMPTKDDVEELLNNCTWTKTTHNRVAGYNVEGPNGNSIFLPVTQSSYCNYWSSTLDSSNPKNAYRLSIPSANHSWGGWYRFVDCSVRPVMDK